MNLPPDEFIREFIRYKIPVNCYIAAQLAVRSYN